MPQSKIEPKNPLSSTDGAELIQAPTAHDGEPTSPTLTVSLHPLALGSPPREATPSALPSRREGPSAGWSRGSSRDHTRGGAKAYGPARRFNSRHRG
jgi:hypothetical protein